MKELYIECNMGAAGDMLMGALIELIPDKQAFLTKMNSLGLPGVEVSMEPSVKCGIAGTHMKVVVHGEEEESIDIHEHNHGDDHGHEYECAHTHEHEHTHSHDHEHEHSHESGCAYINEHEHEHSDDHEHEHEHKHSHHHAGLPDIRHIISHLPVSDKVREDAKAVYAIIAAAESQVHGRAVEEVHFHEVGTLDALADVVGVCLLMEELGVEQVSASPVHVGSGQVRCAHGILPVPAPATALILEGIPTYGGQVKGELCTPTGAALLKHFCKKFGDRPIMAVDRIGYGMGNKDFERANCVRVFYGETSAPVEDMCKLECNLDDMTGEELGFAMEILFENGARDVYTQPIGMKKNRPGTMLCVICKPDHVDLLTSLIFKHTTTLGIRRFDCSRYFLERSVRTIDTIYGPVRLKQAEGAGTKKAKYEYEDLARIARETGRSLAEVRKLID